MRRAGNRPIHVLKDLSDFYRDIGAERLVSLLDPPSGGVSVVCANEGQLRACVSEDASGRTRPIVETLATGMTNGAISSADSRICVINLNFQSVAPDSGREGLVEWATRIWAVDKRSWRACRGCDAKANCPIFSNHQELSEPEAGPRRRAALRDIFGAAERAGAVITARQALATIAYAITGGLKCQDVHRRHISNPTDKSWQYPFMYHQSLFGDRLLDQQREQVASIQSLRKLDPGQVSRREVDDYLDYESAVTRFVPPYPDGSKARTNQEASRQAKESRRVYAFLRRLDYFNGAADTRFARLGLSAGDAFVSVDAEKSDAEKTKIRDLLLKGLEAVQGIHRVGSNPDFLVLDPAFFAHRAKAAVIGRSVNSKNITVVDQLTYWQAKRGQADTGLRLDQVVEWLNRAVHVEIPGPKGRGGVSVPVDLSRFELLTRWAGGLRSGSHHEAQIRGITSVLAEVADASDEREVIQVLVGSSTRQLTIDVGDQIRSVRTL